MHTIVGSKCAKSPQFSLSSLTPYHKVGELGEEGEVGEVGEVGKVRCKFPKKRLS